jgi:hypothetical protein
LEYQTITSDRDKIFRSDRWKETMKELKVESVRSTVEHQTDGWTERTESPRIATVSEELLGLHSNKLDPTLTEGPVCYE